jgi:hypothetical protein
LVHEVLPVCRRDSSNSYPISFETNDLSRVKLSGVSSVSSVQKNLAKAKGVSLTSVVFFWRYKMAAARVFYSPHQDNEALGLAGAI